ncbi:MAG: restriction endonuclease [Anaerolineae bacterium]
MTYLDAAYSILHAAGRPLRFEEITEAALGRKLISPQGLTPEATMASRLYIDSLQEDSRFVRAGKGVFGLVQWRPEGIEAQVEKINRATREQLHGLLLEMPSDRFEALIGELLIRMGFDESTVTVTRRSGDGGIDVTGLYRATGLTGVSAAVQAKRWKANVQAPTVTSLRGSLQVQQQGIIISTSDFSKGARVEATAPNKSYIGLINGQELVELLVRHKVGVREKPLPVLSLDQEFWGDLIGQSVEPPAAASQVTATPAPVAPPLPEAELAKPDGFTLLGQHYPGAASWRAVLLGVCSSLAAHHGPAFADAACAVKGRTRHYVASSADGMISPAQIPGTTLWIETNQSAKSVVQVIGKLLAALGHAPDQFTVNRAMPPQIESRPVSTQNAEPYLHRDR